MQVEKILKYVALFKDVVLILGVPSVATIAIYMHQSQIDILKEQVKIAESRQYKVAWEQIEAQRKLYQNEINNINHRIDQLVKSKLKIGKSSLKNIESAKSLDDKVSFLVEELKLEQDNKERLKKQNKILIKLSKYKEEIYSQKKMGHMGYSKNSPLNDFLEVVYSVCEKSDKNECKWINEVFCSATPPFSLQSSLEIYYADQKSLEYDEGYSCMD